MTLRATDLVEGQHYYSPSGRLCKLVEYRREGNYQGRMFFAYIERARGVIAEDNGFTLSELNTEAIGAMREARGVNT